MIDDCFRSCVRLIIDEPEHVSYVYKMRVIPKELLRKVASGTIADVKLAKGTTVGILPIELRQIRVPDCCYPRICRATILDLSNFSNRIIYNLLNRRIELLSR